MVVVVDVVVVVVVELHDCCLVELQLERPLVALVIEYVCQVPMCPNDRVGLAASLQRSVTRTRGRFREVSLLRSSLRYRGQSASAVRFRFCWKRRQFALLVWWC